MVGFTNTNERKLHVLPLNCLKNKVSVSFLFFFSFGCQVSLRAYSEGV